MPKIQDKTNIICHHCGDECKDEHIFINDKHFCCAGCKTVYEILYGNDLCAYYSIEDKSGIKKADTVLEKKFDYLDDKDIQNKILEFSDKTLSSVTFNIPNIHCASCIWLLEKLYKLNKGIVTSKVDFLQKTVSVVFEHAKISLKEVVILLSSIGYEPQINPDNNETGKKFIKNANKKLLLKIGITGFCLGNIMLLSFPEYLGLDSLMDGNLKTLFNYLNILFSLPVFFYCSSDYFISARNGIKNKLINIDLPISLGLAALFVRSMYEILFFNNAGFIDSLAGLVFLLLLGKLFQNKTYDALNFERDYKSYFPVSVTIKKHGIHQCIPVSNLNVGDRIIIRNNEIIPADAILFSGTGSIDYSFVTGESIPEQKVLGEIIYAGGRHIGSAIELEVVRKVSQSYLTKLWNDKAFYKTESNVQQLTNTVSKYFTAVLLLVAVSSAFYWLGKDNINYALNAFTTVLIIACPCALALTTPFALGNAMRILGRNKFYLKNAFVIESLAGIDTIVFDKTGTITNSKDINVKFTGSSLNLCEEGMVKSLVRNSSHPLSRMIFDSIQIKDVFAAEDFKESLSEGISCCIDGKKIKLGSIRFVLEGLENSELKKEISGAAFTTNVFLSIDDCVKGFYSFSNKYREGLGELLSDLSEDYKLSLISGDNSSEKNNLYNFFKNDEELLFKQTPSDKLNYIKTLQKNKQKVLMIGDGLNDAGALKQSDAGISVAEDVTNFSPSCDVIIDAGVFTKLNDFIKYSKTTMNIIKISFAISFIYNIIGLYLAAQGTFSPLVAAVLMPFNSISIILFVTGMTNFCAKRRKLL